MIIWMYFIHHNPSNSNKGWIKKKATYSAALAILGAFYGKVIIAIAVLLHKSSIFHI